MAGQKFERITVIIHEGSLHTVEEIEKAMQRDGWQHGGYHTDKDWLEKVGAAKYVPAPIFVRPKPK